jgi:general stress protein 26
VEEKERYFDVDLDSDVVEEVEEVQEVMVEFVRDGASEVFFGNEFRD